jgi:hypothetical protein
MSEGTKWRRSEYISVATLTLVISSFWWAATHVDHWNIVDDAECGNKKLCERMTVMETTVKDKQDAEMRILVDIRRDLERR